MCKFFQGKGNAPGVITTVAVFGFLLSAEPTAYGNFTGLVRFWGARAWFSRYKNYFLTNYSL
ncbi:MAG: hypothetical protein ACXITV_04030 [Luteibaculaceae bacterium]